MLVFKSFYGKLKNIFILKNPKQNMQLKEAIKTRRSAKRFSEKKPNWRKIIQSIDAGRFTPSAGNQYHLKFVFIQDKDRIKELSEAADQPFIGKASNMIAVVSDEKKLTRLYDKKGKEYGKQQTGAAIQNILLALTEFKMAACWVGWFNESKVKKILDIPSDLNVEALIPVGTKDKIDTKERRKAELEDLLFFEKWKNKFMDKNFY